MRLEYVGRWILLGKSLPFKQKENCLFSDVDLEGNLSLLDIC